MDFCIFLYPESDYLTRFNTVTQRNSWNGNETWNNEAFSLWICIKHVVTLYYSHIIVILRKYLFKTDHEATFLTIKTRIIPSESVFFWGKATATLAS